MPVTKRSVFSSPPQTPLHLTFFSPAPTDNYEQLHPDDPFPHFFQRIGLVPGFVFGTALFRQCQTYMMI